ncbi:MAG TPA: metal-dependent transcriptional regulator [Acidimicrobiales bacterium]|nr:metal-dependent transcriptional regulator [Acidimicrobiales bacterium]
MPDLARAKAPAGASPGGPPGAAGASPSHAAARYLEAIYYLSHEGQEVRPGRLAEWLGVSAPTVTVALQRLVRDGLVRVDTGRSVSFTEEGEQAAAAAVRRHRVVECWLTEELGFDWVTADAEAERVAYALSDVVLGRLYEKLGRPATCPHGNEIPGAVPRDRRLISLAVLEDGQAGQVSRISELAEHDAPQVLGVLVDEGVIPGATVVAESRSGDPGVVLVNVDGRRVALSRATAASVWVEPAGPSG